MTRAPSPKNQTKPKKVICTNCGHQFISKIKYPRCSKCRLFRTIETNVKGDLKLEIYHNEVQEVKEIIITMQKELNLVLEQYAQDIFQIATHNRALKLAFEKAKIPVPKIKMRST